MQMIQEAAVKAPRITQVDIMSVGLSLSDQLLVNAYLQLIAPTDGQAVRLSESTDAPIVIFNPADEKAAALLRNPKRGVAYIQLGMPERSHGRVWLLATPVRLPALREIISSIMNQRREWQFSGAIVPEPLTSLASAVPVPAHRRLEHVLGLLETVVQSRMPHAFSGVSGVEILVSPQSNEVYIRCDSSVSSWQKALADTQRPLAVLSRIGARSLIDVRPISVAHFRWELAQHLSAGMLLPGIANRQEFGLSRWPDFGTMSPGSSYDLRIAALISTRSTSIAGLLRAVPHTREGIIAMLNGCALVGCLRDPPEDLLHSVESKKPALALLGERSYMATANQTEPRLTGQTGPLTSQTLTEPSLTNQKPRSAFGSVLSKLRAALTYTPWSRV